MIVTEQRPAEVPERLLYLHDADVTARDADSLGRLSERFAIEVPPYPGFEGELDPEGSSWRDWDSAADLAYHVRERGRLSADEPVHLLGAGLGGWVGLELALASPWVLRSLVLVSPYGVKLGDRTQSDFADILLLDAAEQVELGWADPGRAHSMRIPGYPPSPEDRQHELAFTEHATLARYIWKPFLHSPRLKRWLHLIDLPILVVSGAEDRMLAPGHSERLAALLPDSSYAEIPDAGHYPYLEQPDVFQRVVGEFYESLEDRT